MTTCPSGVDYRRLVDHARAAIETSYRRPFADRLMRAALARLLPSRALFRASLSLAAIGRPFAPILARVPAFGDRLAAMLALAPKARSRGAAAGPGEFRSPAPGAKRRRVALLAGCAQEPLAPEINAATIRLLNRAGVDVVLPEGEGCCGALLHHMGRERASARSRARQRRRLDARAWRARASRRSSSPPRAAGRRSRTMAICCATIPLTRKRRRGSPHWRRTPANTSAGLELAYRSPGKIVVAYHAACSLQHGMKILEGPKALLRRAGFEVRSPTEGHICCGSAGTYNILQPEMAAALRERKVANLSRLKPDVIAAGNIGCIAQIASGTSTPVVHTVELLDWASGGPKPAGLG